MNRRFLWLLLLTVGLRAYAQETAHVYPAIKRSGARVRDFVPAGWDTLATAKGDLNKDSLADVAVVIQRKKTTSSAEDGFPEAEPRLLLVLFGARTGLNLACQSNVAILLADAGGAMGDPFEQLAIERGTLVTGFYGGSRDKWNMSYRYRYQQGDFYLIGADAWGGNESYAYKYSYNLLTGRLQVEAQHEETPGKNRKYQKVVKPANLPLLKSFEPWSLQVAEDIHF
jgi:hypothetical protein